jgi:membrane-associated phospholipid phosphatase
VHTLAVAAAIGATTFLLLVPMAWHTAQVGRFDRWVLDANLPRYSSVFSVGRVLSVVGSGTMVTIAAIRLVYLVWRRARRPWLAFGAIVAIGGSAIVEYCAKAIIARPRPSTATLTGLSGYGFPSGHTTTATAFASTAAVLLLGVSPEAASPRQRHLITGIAGLYALGVAAGRIMVGAHYLTDTVAGLAIGASIAFAALAAALTAEARRNGATYAATIGRG